MKKSVEPVGIAPPASAYRHALLSQGVTDLLTLSGQLGERPDGSCVEDAKGQALQAWHNIRAILEEADMDLSDIVKVTSFIVGQENITPYVEAHKEVLGDLLPPWTLVVVAALGHPEYLIEVDVMAATTAAG